MDKQLAKQAAASFREQFGSAPTHLVWSPGRLNIIGEHTDYNLLPVLPMALSRGLVFAVAPNNRRAVRFANASREYEPFEISIEPAIPPAPAGNWSNYTRAAVHKAAELFGPERLAGFDAVVSSNLPPASGLSSSSALVVGSFLAHLTVSGIDMDPAAAADAMRVAEHYVGTAGGGMDQAAILLGRAGCALRIDFDPLRTEAVPVPADAAFFAIDSLTRAAKAGGARIEYNRRVFECSAGLELIAQWALSAGLVQEAGEWTSLRDASEGLGRAGINVSRAALAAIGTGNWTFDKLNDSLGERLDALLERKRLPARTSDAWQAFDGFRIFERLMHVFAEAGRVEECVAAFKAGDLSRAAAAMNASHASCRDLYHISTPEIERLVHNAMRSGAMAARIVGAGFGGSVVCLVRADDAAAFAAGMWAQHFVPAISAGDLPDSDASAVIIETRASAGADAWRMDAGEA
jgi:N-acetylgalactosamine kinase